MSHFRLYYHVVFATKGRAPLITPALEKVIDACIGWKSKQLDCIVHALDGIPDHVHIAVTIPPKLAISDEERGIANSNNNEPICKGGFETLPYKFYYMIAHD